MRGPGKGAKPRAGRYDCGQDVAMCGNAASILAKAATPLGIATTAKGTIPAADCQPLRCGDGVVDSGEDRDLSAGCAPDGRWLAAR